MKIEILKDKQAVAERAAEMFVEKVNMFTAAQGVDNTNMCVALAGGTTPKALYNLLTRQPWHQQIPWNDIEWFIGDERYVPSDHADSNFKMIRENLFEPARVDDKHCFRVMTELPTPQGAAADYEGRLIDCLRANAESAVPSALDVVFLGMGADGHTASLFPHTAALQDGPALVVSNWIEKLGAWRITITRRVIEEARQILVMVTGDDKAEALAHVLEGEINIKQYPAQLLRDLPSVTWLVDKAAANRLKQ